jgi:hypothetical protein
MATLVVMVFALACARTRNAAPPSGRIGLDSVFVEVINDNYYDARVHLIYTGATLHSLGTIAGNQRLPVQAVPWDPQPIVIEIALIVGGGTYRSDRIQVAPRDVLQIRVPPNFETSTFFRRVSR